MTETTAKLAARKLNDEAGIPEDDAEQLWKIKGSKRVAIVELEAFERSDNVDDKKVVRLRVTHLELMPDGRLADLARDMSRKAYDLRQPAGLDVDVTAESVDELADRGTAVLELVGGAAP